MKQRSPWSRKGVIAGYFLVIFLLAASLLTTAAVNDMRRLRTLENIRCAQQRTQQEAAAVHELMCRLKAGEQMENPVYLTLPDAPETTVAVFIDEASKEIIYWTEECRKP